MAQFLSGERSDTTCVGKMTRSATYLDIVRDAELPSPRLAEHLMSMPSLRQRVWTIDQVERLMDERPGYAPRYELIDGELLVTPAPNRLHQRIVIELFVLQREYVKRHRLGETVISPSTVTLTPETRVEPDIYVIPVVAGRMPRWKDAVTRLLLAVEVLSPSSARHDRLTKRRFFQRQGVPEYWVVDGEAEAFEVWRPGDDRAALIDDHLVWQPRETVPAFELDVRSFFASVADEDDELPSHSGETDA
jgi:Uma2 family endonuclease